MRMFAGGPQEYLVEDETVNWGHPTVLEVARRLPPAAAHPVEYATSAFAVVRDEVRHSVDAQDRRMSVTASETLAHRVGLCYAKSHLLAALLRAGGIPAGLCYQRLGNLADGYVIHGLVAVHLDGDWHRQDPRGNKPGIDARFSLDEELLAYRVDPELGEVDYPRVYVHPHPAVLAALRSSDDALALCAGGLPTELPDLTAELPG